MSIVPRRAMWVFQRPRWPRRRGAPGAMVFRCSLLLSRGSDGNSRASSHGSGVGAARKPDWSQESPVIERLSKAGTSRPQGHRRASRSWIKCSSEQRARRMRLQFVGGLMQDSVPKIKLRNAT